MANDEKNIIDRLFADGLGEAEMPVSNDLWKGIAAEMETDRLRKKVFVARMTAAASLVLLLGLSTWFFVSSSFQRSETQRFTTGEVISLPYQDSAGLDGNFAGNQSGAFDETREGSNLDQRFASAQNTNGTDSRLPSYSNTPRAGLDLSAFFIDQYGGSGTDRFKRFRDLGNARGNTQLNGNSSTENATIDQDFNSNNDGSIMPVQNNNGTGNALIAQADPNNASSEDPLISKTNLNDIGTPLNEKIGTNPDQEVIALNTTPSQNDEQVTPIDENPVNYTLQEKVLVETVNPLASLVSHDDLNEVLRNNNRSEAIVASTFDFDEKKSNDPKSRWAFGGAFAPDYSFSTASPVQDQINPASRTLEIQEPTEAAKTPSSLVTAFTTGINLSYKVSERLGVQSGLFYSNRKSTTTSDVSSFGKNLLLNSDFSLNQLEIPMLLQYSIVKRDHLDYYVSSGISANLLWNYNNSISNAEGQVAARVVSSEENTLQP